MTIATALTITFLAVGGTQAQTQTGAPDAEIQQILADRIDVQRQSVGVVVGVIEPTGRRVVAHGGFANGDPRPCPTISSRPIRRTRTPTTPSSSSISSCRRIG